MKVFKRSIPLLVVLITLLSSCTSLCCNKESRRIEADIAMATERKEDVEAVQKDAYQRMAWAKSFGLDKDFPNEYGKASGDLASADLAYDNLKYPTSKSLYLDVIATLSDNFQTNAQACRDEKTRAEAAMQSALEACADVYAPEKFKAAQNLYSKALALKEAGDLPNALATCKQAATAFDDAAQIGAQAKAEADRLTAKKAAEEKEAIQRAEAQKAAQEAAEKRAAEERAAAERQAEAAKLASEKAVAGAALSCAGDGMAWADRTQLYDDHPKDYVWAKEQLAAAQAYFASGNYVDATDAANQVCNYLNAGYRAEVIAERNAKAEADRLTAKKAAEEKEAIQRAEAQKAAQEAAEKRAAEERAAQEAAKLASQPSGKLVVTNSPQDFSPDGDGENDLEFFDITMPTNTDVATWQLTLYEDDIVDPRASTYQVKTYAFKTWTGTGTPPSRIVWDGKSDSGELVESGWTYPYIFKYVSTTGKIESASGTVDVGIIIQKRGNDLVLRFPSLVFDPDKATFTQLASSVIERNNGIMTKLVKLLAQYPDYHITIEGHANNVGKMMGYSKAKIDNEEKTEVLPLSAARAEKIKAMLVANGITANRISTRGYGSSQPIYSFTDAQNRWKNRRVEFVLTKASKE